MKRNKLILFLILEAGLVILLHCLLGRQSDMDASAAAFPFLPLAKGLEALAAAGTIGAGLAAALWLGVSGVPGALALGRGEKGMPERIALCFLSVVMVVGLYGMVRPLHFLPEVLRQPEAVPILQAGLGFAIWSAVILWGVVHLIRRFRNGGWESLLRSAGVLILVLCVLLTAAAALAVSGELLALTEGGDDNLETVVAREWYSEELSIPSDAGGLDASMSLIHLLTRILPLILTVAVLLRGMELLDALRTGALERLVPAAEGLSRSCCLALGVTAAVTAAVNLLQVLVARFLTNLSFRAEIPLLSLVLTVLLLLFARLVIENKKLRDDNSLFI